MQLKTALTVVASGAVVAADGAPTVTVQNGTLQGGQCASSDINYFLSVPFAQPPVGDARFTASASFDESYNGTRLATTPAPACIQFGSQFIETTGQSEDCLYIDIWAPANATADSNLPVKTWLYGGGNAAGGISDVLYNGCLAETEAVQVNINYRLGPMGWFALESAGLSGNYGLQDIILALQWIQENIGAFGGDKDKVMLYGQSAGAIDAYTVATLPQAKSLINTAIFESGAGTDLPTMASTQRLYEYIATQLNCSTSDAACLRSISPEQMNDTVNNLPNFGIGIANADSLLGNNGYGVEFGPIIDGVVVPAKPTEAGLKVPAIIGSTTTEGELFVLGTYGLAAATLTEADYDQFLTDNFGSVASTVNNTYSVSVFEGSVFAAMSSVITDYGYRCPTYRALLSADEDVAVYTYQFNHTPSCTWMTALPQEFLSTVGPTHTSELAFVFGVFSNLPGAGNCTLTSSERQLSLDMQTAWTNMANTGIPNSDWPAFTANGSEGVIYNDSPEVSVVDYSMCAFWDQIDSQVQQISANQTKSSNTTTATSPTPSSNAMSVPLSMWTIIATVLFSSVNICLVV
ncbi:Carboxylesterase [Xylariales sp. PMI_506]|nr:Carboxylesterase [Xylariales sp. PMI_506]